MQTVLVIALSNAVVATALALLAAASRPLGRPALTHALWLLVLVKLVTPPVFRVPVRIAESDAGVAAPLPRAAKTGPARPRMELWPKRQEADLFVVEGPGRPNPDFKFEISNQPAGGAAETSGPTAATQENAVEHAIAAEPIATAHEPLPAIRADIPWLLLAALTWGFGSLVCAAVVLRRLAVFRRVLRHAAPAPLDVQWQADLLARRLGMDNSPPVLMLPGPVCPMLVALGSARLLVPSGLWSELDEDQRQSLLLHELAHLRRRDHWVRVLEAVVTTAYWWLPTAWAARRALREAEEQCCDAWVLWAMPGPRGVRAYATALLETLEFTARATSNTSVQGRPLRLPALASGLGEFHQLKRRLVMIKQARASRRLSWGGALLVAGLLAALPLSPSVAQVAEDQPAAAPAPAIEPPPIPSAEPVAPVLDVPAVTPAPVAGIEAEGPFITGAAASTPRPGKASAPPSAAAQKSSRAKAAKGPDEDDAREELEDAQREVKEAEKELKKAVDKLAKLQQKMAGKGPMGPMPTPRPPDLRGKFVGPGAQNNRPPEKWGQWEGRAPHEMDREMRLQQLENQLARMLDEVRSLRQENNAAKKQFPSDFKPMPDPRPKKQSPDEHDRPRAR